MKYGQGFWVVENGIRQRWRDRAYPSLLPFEYDDNTGDRGWLLTRDFTVDYVKPGDTSGLAWRFTVKGDANPAPYLTAFDYDGASIPPALRAIARDKMDHRWIVASLLHDLGYCIHNHKTGFSKADWDTLLLEVGGAYGDNAYQCAKYRLAVTLGGWNSWPKTEAELERYRNLCYIERVSL